VDQAVATITPLVLQVKDARAMPAQRPAR
jgi:hypothetical protein